MVGIKSSFLGICLYWLLGAMFICPCESSPDASTASAHNNEQNKPDMVSMSNLKSIGAAIRGYADDQQGNFPSSLEELYPKYISDLKVLENPAKPVEIDSKQEIPQETGYEYIVGRGKFASFDIVVLYEKYESDPGGKYVLFGDGTTEWKSKDELSILLARQTNFVLVAVTTSGPTAMFKNLKTGKTYAIKKGGTFEDYVITGITPHLVVIRRKSDSKICKLTVGELLRFTETRR